MPPKQTKAEVCEDESVVTMSVLSQMLEQQREFYKDMLTQQQENFKSFIQVIMEGTNETGWCYTGCTGVEDKSGIHTTYDGGD